MKRSVISRFAVAVLLASSVATSIKAQSGQAGVPEAIEGVNERFAKAFSLGDAEAVAQLFTEDAVMLTPYMNLVKGRVAIADYMRRAFGQGLSEIEFETLEIEQAGDAAYEAGDYSAFKGDQRTDRGKYLVVWKRVGSDWLLYRYAMSTSIVGERPAGRVRPESIGSIDWNTTADAQNGLLDQEFTFHCPAGGRIAGVWGTDIYTYDSSICSAAVHEGLITAPEGGVVTIRMKGPLSTYVGTTRNGVISGGWNSGSSSSFEFVK